MDYKRPRDDILLVTIYAGHSSGHGDMIIIDDNLYEADFEYFQLTIVEISLPRGITIVPGSSNTATVRIADNERKY